MECKHIHSPALSPQDDPAGLNVCLYCFNGGCTTERDHAALHHRNSGHPLVLNIKRTRKAVKRDEPPKKVTKLEIAAETEADRYNTSIRVRCYECQMDDVDKTSGKLPAVVDGIMNAMTFARQEEVKAWEQEFTACEHTLCLEQEPAREIASQDLGQCSMCDLKENLWLCLQCGNLACGRSQSGGARGNGHGLAHADATHHPIAVKLGSITPEGTADVYCYSCNDERIDTELAAHLAHWGINIAEREKTEKSLTEMQIEHNLRYDFSMTTEDGHELKPIFGEGFTGLKNIGNSCYLASVLQCLFALPQFKDRYYRPNDAPPAVSKPAEDLETQLRKMADGLLSGRYSIPDSDVTLHEDSDVHYQKGLAPAMLKHLIGRGHKEFSTMRQQDASELLLHLFKHITRSQHPAPFRNPVSAFTFVMEQRLQCINCRKVRYRTDEQDNISIPIPVRRLPHASSSDPKDADTKKDDFAPVTLKECLDIFTAAESVELTCSSCNSKAGFVKRSLFKTFPAVLAINARRFEHVNWVPTKLDIPVVVPDTPFTMDAYISKGLQPGEEELPDDGTNTPGAPPAFTPNEVALEALQSMGFPRPRCERALHATGNADAESAMNWLFAHMDDADIDDPVNSGVPVITDSVAAPNEEQIEMLGAMGFGPAQAKKALRETGGDVERAVEWLFSHPDEVGEEEADGVEKGPGEGAEGGNAKELPGSAELPATFQLQSIVCHKGGSIHAGHYVAFIRKPLPHEQTDSWVLFNDEKVVKALDADEMKKFAYVYFFRRL
ncbi:MAG: hypothetical protein M1824_006650 [Vezdaea acicularis]|nr:MAG: hypothetical protein M1824_006650 [Vezdaea acicularis]